MPTDYNFIYDKLVEDENDVLGIVAYSVYKRQKIEFLKENGDEHISTFNTQSQTRSQLDMYLNEADTILSSFAEIYLETDLQERESFFQTKLQDELKEKAPSFWTGVFQSIVGSFGFVLCLGILIFTIWSAKLSVKSVIESIFEVTITSAK